jgi:hypothetical protein
VRHLIYSSFAPPLYFPHPSVARRKWGFEANVMQVEILDIKCVYEREILSRDFGDVSKYN